MHLGFLAFPSAAGGGGVADAFSTIQPDAGTSPVAVGASTLTLTSTDNSLVITGDSATDKITFTAGSNLLLLAGRGTGGQTVTDPLKVAASLTSQTVFVLDPITGSNIDFRFENANFRIDRGSGTLLFFASGYVNIGGTRTPLNQVEIQCPSTNTAPTTGITQNVANLPMLAIVNSSTTANNWSALCFTANSTSSTGHSSAVVGVHESHTSGSETGHLEFLVRNAGTMAEAYRITKDGTLQNKVAGNETAAVLGTAAVTEYLKVLIDGGGTRYIPLVTTPN